MAKETEVKKEAEVSEGLTEREVQLIERIVREMKKPYVDETLENRKAKYRAELRAAEKERVEREKLVQEACYHQRDEDGSSTFFWHLFPDKVIRGVCCRCLRVAVPSDPDYKELRKRPTGKYAL